MNKAQFFSLFLSFALIQDNTLYATPKKAGHITAHQVVRNPPDDMGTGTWSIFATLFRRTNRPRRAPIPAAFLDSEPTEHSRNLRKERRRKMGHPDSCKRIIEQLGQQSQNESHLAAEPLILAVATCFKKQLLNMNNILFTAGVTATYELLRILKLRPTFPLPKVFKQRLASAVRGGLYASIFNALLWRKELAFITQNYTAINGWKVIGSYIIVDLIIRYSCDLIKKLQAKSVENSEIKNSQK